MKALLSTMGGGSNAEPDPNRRGIAGLVNAVLIAAAIVLLVAYSGRAGAAAGTVDRVSPGGVAVGAPFGSLRWAASNPLSALGTLCVARVPAARTRRGLTGGDARARARPSTTTSRPPRTSYQQLAHRKQINA